MGNFLGHELFIKLCMIVLVGNNLSRNFFNIKNDRKHLLDFFPWLSLHDFFQPFLLCRKFFWQIAQTLKK